MKKSYILLVVLLIILGAGFYYKDALLKTFGRSIEDFQHSDLANNIQNVAQEILAPTPLNIGGKQNNAVLTKASIITQTNLQRQENGSLPALKENTKLNAAALAKANDMFENQYFEHVSPFGVDPGKLVKSYGYEYIISGENLILGNFKDEKELVQAWMDSPGHRANILNNRYADIGVAVVKGVYKGDTVWIGVQEFGLPLSACPSPNSNLKVQIDANMATLNQLSVQIDAKRQQIDNTNPRSGEYNDLVDEYNALVNQYNSLNQTTKGIIAQYNGQVNAFNECVAGK